MIFLYYDWAYFNWEDCVLPIVARIIMITDRSECTMVGSYATKYDYGGTFLN